MSREDGKVLAGAVVRVSDKDLRRDELLGEVNTNKEGKYGVSYSKEQFARAEKKRAINIVVPTPPRPKLSEFEKLLASLSPLLENLPLTDRRHEDIPFLLKELQGDQVVNQRRLELLIEGAQLSVEMQIVVEALYGAAVVLRMNSPLTTQAFLGPEPADIGKALITAVKQNVVPKELESAIDDIVRRLEQLRFDRGVLISRELVGRLLDRQTETPLVGYTVRVFELDVPPTANTASYDVTNSQGLFAVSYTAPG